MLDQQDSTREQDTPEMVGFLLTFLFYIYTDCQLFANGSNTYKTLLNNQCVTFIIKNIIDVVF